MLGLEDDTGSVAADERYDYDPYGELDETVTLSPEAQENPFRFEGFYYDSGVKSYDAHARRYRPDIGRYLTQDRYASASADLLLQADPLTQNRYAFAGANPVTNIEFDGHCPKVHDEPCSPVGRAPTKAGAKRHEKITTRKAETYQTPEESQQSLSIIAQSERYGINRQCSTLTAKQIAEKHERKTISPKALVDLVFRSASKGTIHSPEQAAGFVEQQKADVIRLPGVDRTDVDYRVGRAQGTALDVAGVATGGGGVVKAGVKYGLKRTAAKEGGEVLLDTSAVRARRSSMPLACPWSRTARRL